MHIIYSQKSTKPLTLTLVLRAQFQARRKIKGPKYAPPAGNGPAPPSLPPDQPLDESLNPFNTKGKKK